MRGKTAPARHWRKYLWMAGTSLAVVCAAAGAVLAADADTRFTPPPEAYYKPGSESWPKEPTAPAGAPNVLLIMTDDVGFAASSTYGGPIPTPTFDALARDGLKYNAFHTTALCSPTRAALLTGRNQHNVGMGNVEELATGFPGYNSVIPKSAATIAEILKENGYNTAMFGKSNFTPEWDHSAAGSFDNWPTGLGFEYFYGFLHTDTDQYAPALVENTLPVNPPADDPSYILDKDLANQAITWIEQHRAVAPQKPFFMYYATGSTHTPHQAPRDWLMKFRGKFHQGWDKVREETFARQKAMGVIPADAKLTPRPAELPAWESLTPDQQMVAERLMEAYAAQLAYVDFQIGRVIDELRQSGQLDNTLVIFLQGDNGPSGEGGLHGELFQQSGINKAPEDWNYVLSRVDDIGGPKLYNHYPAPWAWAMATPFPWMKQIASHFGGTANGLVISWPERIRQRGQVRTQFSYVTDIAPTIYEAAGVTPPATVRGVTQKPIDGISLVYSFDHPQEPSHRHVQYFEIFQNLGIYKDGWMASTRPAMLPWKLGDVTPLDQRTWELYNIAEDYSQSTDLAARNPDKLREMQALFFAEAKRNQVLPIHFYEGMAGRPTLRDDRKVFTYPNGIMRVPQDTGPNVTDRSFSISADFEVGKAGGTGVLLANGGQYGGYSLYVKDGHPVFAYNAIPPRVYTVRSDAALSPGHHVVKAEISSDGGKGGVGATVTLSIDGKQTGQGRVEHTLSNGIFNTEGLDVGQDTLTPVSDDYRTPARYPDPIKAVTITVE